MNTRRFRKQTRRGSVLAVTLFLAFLFGLFLFYYLSLAKGQRTMVARAQAWNASLGLAEAGAEEALAQLNPGAPQPAIDRTANGWGAASAGLYGPMSRTLTNGSYSAVYTTDTFPVIYATGYVAVASLSANLSRTVRLTTKTVPLFGVGMAAVGNINLNGNNINTDSFDSGHTNAWTSSTPQGTNGSIASLQGLVNVGNGNVHGTVYLGPAAANTVGSSGFVTGGVSNDFNASFPDVILPSTTPIPAVALNTNIAGVTYQYAFIGNSGYYSVPALTGNLYVGPSTQITLLINGNASPGTIYVDGPGVTAGKLIIYMNGPSFTLSGQSTVIAGIAADLAYYGTPNNTSFTMSGNASFCGTVYAPEAAVSMGGGGSNPYDFVGSLICKSVTMNGHFNFHFDEDLLRDGPARGYVATGWTEL
ncbi:MAG TPA: hypothetical protein VG167_01610 [Verrucomicrobiae bacterium]|nr:hypothetical protein [Verrucomicrobiae bacterium]